MREGAMKGSAIAACFLSICRFYAPSVFDLSQRASGCEILLDFSPCCGNVKLCRAQVRGCAHNSGISLPPTWSQYSRANDLVHYVVIGQFVTSADLARRTAVPSFTGERRQRPALIDRPRAPIALVPRKEPLRSG